MLKARDMRLLAISACFFLVSCRPKYPHKNTTIIATTNDATVVVMMMGVLNKSLGEVVGVTGGGDVVVGPVGGEDLSFKFDTQVKSSQC